MDKFCLLYILREKTMPKDWKPDRFWKKTKDEEKKEDQPPAEKKKKKKSKLKLSIPSKKKRTR
jgi:hypothetical protein